MHDYGRRGGAPATHISSSSRPAAPCCPEQADVGGDGGRGFQVYGTAPPRPRQEPRWASTPLGDGLFHTPLLATGPSLPGVPRLRCATAARFGGDEQVAKDDSTEDSLRQVRCWGKYFLTELKTLKASIKISEAKNLWHSSSN
ncbi:hypothetical protein ABZP36_019374 [Zizania latifolia]